LPRDQTNVHRSVVGSGFEEDVMTKTILAALLGALPVLGLAANWENVPIVDHSCADVAKANPDGHPRDCLIQCAASGYEILDHGTWIALDAAGNREAFAALKGSNRKDHVRVNVTGERDGHLIHARSVSVAE
jgi:hypothetical protein